MCLWHIGKVSVSHTGDSGFEPSNPFKIIIFLSLNSANSVKTFRENSNGTTDFPRKDLLNPILTTFGDQYFLIDSAVELKIKLEIAIVSRTSVTNE